MSSSDQTNDAVNVLRERIQASLERQRKRTLRVLFYFAGSILVLLLVMLIGWAVEGPKFFVDANEERAQRLEVEIAALRHEMAQQASQVAEQLRIVSSAPRDYTPSIEAAQLKQRVDAIDKKIEDLEAAIEDSPEKALSVPMLRKDVSELTQRWSEDKVDIRARLDHIDDMQKWILGGIGVFLLTMLAASGSLIISLVRKNPTAA